MPFAAKCLRARAIVQLVSENRLRNIRKNRSHTDQDRVCFCSSCQLFTSLRFLSKFLKDPKIEKSSKSSSLSWLAPSDPRKLLARIFKFLDNGTGCCYDLLSRIFIPCLFECLPSTVRDYSSEADMMSKRLS
jgi:hypothetical protein